VPVWRGCLPVPHGEHRLRAGGGVGAEPSSGQLCPEGKARGEEGCRGGSHLQTLSVPSRRVVPEPDFGGCSKAKPPRDPPGAGAHRRAGAAMRVWLRSFLSLPPSPWAGVRPCGVGGGFTLAWCLRRLCSPPVCPFRKAGSHSALPRSFPGSPRFPPIFFDSVLSSGGSWTEVLGVVSPLRLLAGASEVAAALGIPGCVRVQGC